MKKIFFIVMLLFWVVSSSSANNKEIITNYDVSMYLRNDGSATVTENITVISLGRKIHHGIYRDYFLVYKDENGNKRKYSIKIMSVERDGRKEPFHIASNSNGIRLYIGSKDKIIPPGKYNYQIKVKFNNVINFFKDYDSLYYNVTGDKWQFDILKTTFVLYSPDKCSNNSLLDFDGYTGAYGSKKKEYISKLYDKCNVVYESNKRFYMPGDGLTVLIKWNKGVFKKKSTAELFYDQIKENIILIVGMLIIFLYYFIAWLIVGKDPEKGIIIPEYKSPENLSPSAIRFIKRMGYDKKTLTVLIMSLATKGYLRIYEDDGNYTLEKIGEKNTEQLPVDERSIYENLFKTGEILEIDRKNSHVLLTSQSILTKILSKEYKGKYFFSNELYFLAGLLFSFGLLFYTFKNIQAISEEIIFLSVWLLLWSTGLVLMFIAAKGIIKKSLNSPSKIMGVYNVVSYMVILLGFTSAEIMVISKYAEIVTLAIPVYLFYIVTINILFYFLLKAPTKKGRKIMDKIEGFKLYLSVAEEDRLEEMTEKTKPQELFEKFLPYAAALDVENKWIDKFDAKLAALSVGEKSYSPSWYRGTSSFNSSLFVTGLSSSMSSSMSTSSSSGGGFSGGGGGGGGGGGW